VRKAAASFMLVCLVFATRGGLFKQRNPPLGNAIELVGLTLKPLCLPWLFFHWFWNR